MEEILISGIFIGGIVFGLWYYLINVAHMEVAHARGYIMALMVFIQNIHVLNCRSEKHSTFKMSFKPDIIDSYFKDIDVDLRYMTADKKGRDALLETNFSKGNKFEFGYAITTHMSQGSEFNRGMYFEEYLNKNINRNLHYVGITRFKQQMVYVMHKPKFWSI